MRGTGFLDRAIRHLLDAESHALVAERTSARTGLLQGLDARVKIVCALLLVIATASTHDVYAVVVIFALVSALAAASSLSMRAIALRVWLPMLVFTVVIATPALFTTPGTAIAVLPGVSWTITEQGLRTSTLLFARVMTAATIAYVLVMSTTWPRILAALRRLRVPAPVVVLIGMTHRYVFLLVNAAHDMLQSRRSRTVGRLDGPIRRSTTSAMAGSLMLRSLQLGGDVHLAMQSRGFRGAFDTLDVFESRTRDRVALLVTVALASIATWSGR